MLYLDITFLKWQLPVSKYLLSFILRIKFIKTFSCTKQGIDGMHALVP
jgi:hypothetical protein